jgi:hypothetical protein
LKQPAPPFWWTLFSKGYRQEGRGALLQVAVPEGDEEQQREESPKSRFFRKLAILVLVFSIAALGVASYPLARKLLGREDSATLQTGFGGIGEDPTNNTDSGNGGFAEDVEDTESLEQDDQGSSGGSGDGGGGGSGKGKGKGSSQVRQAQSCACPSRISLIWPVNLTM